MTSIERFNKKLKLLKLQNKEKLNSCREIVLRDQTEVMFHFLRFKINKFRM
jgi:hypothetical protein